MVFNDWLIVGSLSSSLLGLWERFGSEGGGSHIREELSISEPTIIENPGPRIRKNRNAFDLNAG